MRVYADSGRFNMVLAHYQNMERLFLEELGVPPSPDSAGFVDNL
jgi:DNA-binding SARP family transcriptional activator